MGVTKGAVMKRGICPGCNQDRPLTTDGVMQGHGGCPGEHEYPKRPVQSTAQESTRPEPCNPPAAAQGSG
jgi:hypothetical protein